MSGVQDVVAVTCCAEDDTVAPGWANIRVPAACSVEGFPASVARFSDPCGCLTKTFVAPGAGDVVASFNARGARLLSVRLVVVLYAALQSPDVGLCEWDRGCDQRCVYLAAGRVHPQDRDWLLLVRCRLRLRFAALGARPKDPVVAVSFHATSLFNEDS